jgi:molecular chaperone DnaK (HSP70)
MKKTYDTVWGLDFGTTTTYLSESDFVGSHKYSLRQAGGSREYVPSAVMPTDAGFTVGEAAIDFSEEEILRSVKRAITLRRETLPIPEASEMKADKDNGPVNADDAIRALLAEVRKIARRDIGDNPVRLGCPAMWDAQQRQRLLRLAKEAGFEIQYDTLIDEPVAACIGWFEAEIRNKRRPSGTTLVFDMGGGTLDVAALKINADHDSPEIYVLASDGIDEAGDALDAAISRVLLEKEEVGSERFAALTRNPGSLRRAARQLKEQLGSSITTSTKLRLGDDQVFDLELTEDDLRSAFEPQFKRAMELVTVVLRIAKTTEWRSNAMTGPELRALSRADLLPQVTNFLLVGGMSQMPLLRKMLIETGVASNIIFGGEVIDADAAVSLGLALDRDYDHLSLDRPGFNFELQWTEAGQPKTEVIYEAYSKLYTKQQAVDGSQLKLTWLNDKFTRENSDTGQAVFCARTTSREILELTFDGELKEGLGPSFTFGLEKTPVIIIQPNGRIFLRDATGAEMAIKVTRWPVINVSRSRTLLIQRSDATGDHVNGLAWHERPYD